MLVTLLEPATYKDFNCCLYRVHQILFFLENALKKTAEYFLKFPFLF